MDKRYQVFVSSTYRDLIEYRQLVIKSLMQVNAIPAGMELFPAADDNAWTIIQRAIDESDYYVVIIGGRYGSVDADGVGFTEKEYDYAVRQGKPVMGFLHAEPGKLERAMTETDPSAWDKLQAFRQTVQKKHCKYWQTKDELVSAVLTSYHQMTYTRPASGWVRGDQAKTIEDVQKLVDLQQRVAELEAENARLRALADDGTRAFAQGADKVRLTLRYPKRGERGQCACSVEMTWDELFDIFGDIVLNDPRLWCMDGAIADACLQRAVNAGVAEPLCADASSQRSWHVDPQEIGRIRNQFLALALVDVCVVGQDSVAWRLTPKGQLYLGRQRAVRREQSAC